MASGNITIDPDVAEVLSGGSCANGLFRLPEGQLDRKLYLKVNKVLEALGGKWNRRRDAHEVGEDFAVRLAAALDAGKAVDKDKAMGFFRTPPEVAAQVVELLGELPAGARVLEPSCGDGALLAALDLSANHREVRVTACELNASRAQLAVNRFSWARIILGDFLDVPYFTTGPFTHILMNPPWGDGREYDHVLHALELLAPGGRLVAVLPTGVRWRKNKAADDFRRALDGAGPYRFHDLPEGSFGISGTGVSACILTLDKKKEG